MSNKHVATLEDAIHGWENIVDDYNTAENKIVRFRFSPSQKEMREELDEHKNANEINKKRFVQTLTDIEGSFNTGKQLFKEDLHRIERLLKTMRKDRRHYRAQQVASLNRAEVEFEDMLSSSEDPLNFQNEKKEQQFLDNTDKQSDQAEDFKMPRMALGGVPLNSDGEPIELGKSGEWLSEYDDDSNSQVERGFV